MLFGKIVELFTDDTNIYLTDKNGNVIESKTAKEFKKDRLAYCCEIGKIEPIDMFSVEMQLADI